MEEKRGVASRIGIVLLNLLSPGLGLLRLGHWRIALALASISWIIAFFLYFAPPVSFGALLAIFGAAILVIAIALIFSWRLSKKVERDRCWYAQWYCILGAAILVVFVNYFETDPDHRRYRGFYLPSESMEPTFPKGDRFIAYMGPLGPLRRGDLVLVRTPAGSIYVKRVAAMGGDRFAMKNGVVFLNDAEVPQRPIGSEVKQWPAGAVTAKRFQERFPGEASSHEILDTGPTPADDVPEVKVPVGAVYLLGDNRDWSADSRVPVEQGGLGGPVAISHVRGRPYYQSWGSSRPLGTRLF